MCYKPKIFYLNMRYWLGYSIAPIGLFIDRNQKRIASTINHESIHWRQQWELCIIPFYLWYGLEALIKWSYYNISFEREAYIWENKLDYLVTRRRFSWFKYLKPYKYNKCK